jgi:hypothetical protein
LDAVKPNYFILSHSKGAEAIKNIQGRSPTPISLLFLNHRIKMLFFLVFLRVKVRFKNIFNIKKIKFIFFFVILMW